MSFDSVANGGTRGNTSVKEGWHVWKAIRSHTPVSDDRRRNLPRTSRQDVSPDESLGVSLQLHSCIPEHATGLRWEC